MGCNNLYTSFCIIVFLSQLGNFKALSNSLNGATFDFIVVGAGTGGCTVAARLAESGEHSVLLITEGGLPHPDLDIPALSSSTKFMQDPNIVKVYHSVPQLNAGIATDGKISYLIGRSLGGGSAINGMWLNRGHPEDYNNWARLTEDESWNYKNLLKYFRKFENYTGNNPTNQRGFDGPITVSLPQYAPGLKEWLEAGKELGYPNTGSNSPQTESVTRVEFTQKKGRRVSSFKGYILPTLKPNSLKSERSKLTIRIHTTAIRLIFECNRALGVTFLSNSSGEFSVGNVFARKEIVVSAGVMDSPALLMRSGIGPRTVLSKAGIHPVKHLPVGKNLQDHVGTVSLIFFGNKSAASAPEYLTPEAWTVFEQTGDGPYSSYWGSGGQAFLISPVVPQNEKELGWSDIQLLPFNSNSTVYLQDSPALRDLREEEIHVVWSSSMARPKSRGSVTLDSENIDNPPLIDFKYFTNPHDMKALIAGTKLMIELCENTSAFRGIGCRVPSTPLAACSHHEFRSDVYWECYTRQLTISALHAGGTCRMGRGPDDAEAVVDTELRVIGIQDLRIVDASIMPVITNANTQGAVYVIAEKAADMILKRWVKKL